MNGGRIKYRNRSIGLPDQQSKLGTAQNNTLDSVLFQPFNHSLELPSGLLVDRADAQLLKYNGIYRFYIGIIWDQHLDPPTGQAALIKVLRHRAFGSEKSHAPDAEFFYLVGGRIRDVYDRDLKRGRDLRFDLVHRIRANQDEIRSGSLNMPGGSPQYLAALLPLAAGLIPFDLREIDTVQNDFCRMQPAQLVLNLLVDDPVVMRGALPTHSTKQSNRFHNM